MRSESCSAGKQQLSSRHDAGNKKLLLYRKFGSESHKAALRGKKDPVEQKGADNTGHVSCAV